ncbi:RES domain-containing protein [Dermatophilaceae bacterium Soc4.6]
MSSPYGPDERDPDRPEVVDRERVAQHPPAVPLDDFPVHTATVRATLHRAHHRDLGPWWFSSSGGRFDLPAPRGTCYLADDPLVALRERIGVVLGGADQVPASLLEATVISRLHLPRAHHVADLTARRASRFGATRELETMVPYAVPQAWALALAAAGHQGVRYGPRFSTGAVTSLAVFGEAGAGSGVVDPVPVPAVDVPGAPVPLRPPRREDLTVVKPPRTRGR